MPDVGRFFNIDPLSEKYAYQSHYNFSENRIINSREIEGLEARDNYDDYEPSRFDDQDYDGGIDYSNRDETGITPIDLSWKQLGKSDAMYGDYDLGDQESDFGTDDAFRFGADFVPLLGSGLDIYDGIKNGNGWLIGIGVVGLAIDIGTLGTGSMLKGGAKAAAKELAENAAEWAVKEAAEEGFTKSSMKLGREVHDFYKVGEHSLELKRFKEFRDIPGIRPDFVDFGTNTIFELKPFNPNGLKTGTKQLEKYKSIFESKYGGTWNTVLEFY